MDNGILSLFLMDPETSLLENLVAVTLKNGMAMIYISIIGI